MSASAKPVAPMKSVADSWIFRRRDVVGVVCLVPLAVLVLFSRPRAPEGSWSDLWMDAVGWAFLAAYALLRIWATLFAGGRKDRQLQTEGPYSITRNPLYLGSFCLALSCCAFLQSLTLLGGVILAFLAYAHGVVAAEERMLLQLFPSEYPDYLQRTARFLPRFSAYRSPQSIEVNLPALQREAKRLAGAALLSVAATVLQILRSLDSWPHSFTLP